LADIKPSLAQAIVSDIGFRLQLGKELGKAHPQGRRQLVGGRNCECRRRARLTRAVRDWSSEYASRALLPCIGNDGVQFRDNLGVVDHIAGFLGISDRRRTGRPAR